MAAFIGGRRALGLGGACVLLLTAALARTALDGSRRERVTAEATRLAEDAGRRARGAWSVQTEALVLLTNAAASNPLLLTALRGGVDGETLADIARNESWWAPYREAVAALSYDGARLAFTQDPDARPLAEAVVAAVRAEGHTVVRTWAEAGRRALLMAGEPIVLRRGLPPAVLVLARRLDDAALQALSARTDAPVLLGDDRGVLAAGGRREDLALLRAAIGHEGARGHLDGDASWATVAIPLGARLWLWTGAHASEYARSLAASDARRTAALWILAALAGAGAIAVTWRARPLVDAPAVRRRDTPAGSLPLPPLAEDGSLVLRPPATPGAPVPLGRYLLLDRIGEGGMAEVYSAVSFGAGGFRRFFVIKRLRAEMVGNATAVAHFIDEANLASTLVHPNIVPVFDFGEIAGTYYIAQEYVVGRDLGRLRRRMTERADGPLSVRAVLFIANELLAGLEYAHDRRDDDGAYLGIVHRDVTPENVMISERGEVKLLDFGIVKTAGGRLSQTEIGHVKGNVDFMAPEQARGRAVDRRADLFSLGLVLHYAATGAPLYDGETLFDRLTRAANGPGPAELARVAALPAPLPEILSRALAIDPDDRFQSASDFRAVVAGHGEGGDAELAAAISRNFVHDLQAEQDRLTSAFPRVRTRDVPTGT